MTHDLMPAARAAMHLIAYGLGYSAADTAAAFLHIDRKAGRLRPPGTFRTGKRFFAAERTPTMSRASFPTTRYPFSQHTAAKSASHCAELLGADVRKVRRIARAYDRLSTGEPLAAVRKRLANGIRSPIELGHLGDWPIYQVQGMTRSEIAEIALCAAATGAPFLIEGA